MDDFLLLAQGLETAEKGLSLLERVQAGGVPLISLCIAAACGAFAFVMLRRNQTLSEQFRISQKADADASLTQQKELMREMLARDREALDAQHAVTKALEGLSGNMKDLSIMMRSVEMRMQTVEAQLAELSKDLGELQRDLRRG